MKPRISVPVFLLVGLTAAGLAGFIFFGRTFPPRLAVHFALDGTPDRWMDRVMFIVVHSSLSFMLPPFVTAVFGVLPRVLPASALHVPNRAYWRAPERAELARDWMLYYGAWLGCLVQGLVLGLTTVVVRANLPDGHGIGVSGVLVGGAFGVAVVVWVWRFLRTFARPVD